MVVGTAVPVGADQWQRALKRAMARPYTVEYLTTRDYNGPVSFYRVSSNSEPGMWRSVAVSRGSGGYGVSCDCPAGERSVPCVHAAVVMQDAGIFDAPAPLEVAAD